MRRFAQLAAVLSMGLAVVLVTSTERSRAESSATPQRAHRIAIRSVNGVAEFYDRVTKSRFVPRGPNYHRFGLEGTYVVDTLFSNWRPKSVAADLTAIRKLGYNTVRTSLDVCRNACIGNPAGGLRARYLDHLADFLRLARARNLRVVITSNDLPYDGGFVPRVEATCCSSFDGYINSHYLSPVGYRAYRDYWTTVVRGLIKRKAPLDTILSYTVRGEMFFFDDKPPLSLTSGSVTTANGRTYALPAQRRQMVEDGTVFWLNGLRAAIRKLDPNALVSVGIFAPNDPYPWRPPEDARTVFVEPILASSVDFVDVHAYPGYISFDQLAADLRLDPARQRKPVVLGEFGGFRFAYRTPQSAASGVMDWQVASCAYGLDGWAHWHWRGQHDREVWTGTDGGGLINTVLSPAQRPNPCERKEFPFLETNLARGRPVTASAQMPGRPGSAAVDGSVSTQWNSGGSPPAWIEVQLTSPSAVKEIRLAVGQFPAGRTVHRLLLRVAGSLQEVRTFDGQTSEGQTLTWRPAAPSAGVTAVRVETLVSPSFVAWNEIEVVG
jgi:hypothetical protein